MNRPALTSARVSANQLAHPAADVDWRFHADLAMKDYYPPGRRCCRGIIAADALNDPVAIYLGALPWQVRQYTLGSRQTTCDSEVIPAHAAEMGMPSLAATRHAVSSRRAVTHQSAMANDGIDTWGIAISETRRWRRTDSRAFGGTGWCDP
jgi:hypothetical protein